MGKGFPNWFQYNILEKNLTTTIYKPILTKKNKY